MDEKERQDILAEAIQQQQNAPAAEGGKEVNQEQHEKDQSVQEDQVAKQLEAANQARKAQEEKTGEVVEDDQNPNRAAVGTGLTLTDRMAWPAAKSHPARQGPYGSRNHD